MVRLSKNKKMNKALFFTVLLLLPAFSFAQENLQNRFIFIEGTATEKEHLDFFLQNFAMEATGAGYIATEQKSDAAHTLKFKVSPDPDVPGEYVINISVLKNDDNSELVNFDFFFANLEDMYTFNRTVFLNATVNIPIPIITEEFLASEQEIRSLWQNKWLYVRASFDYPITFYILSKDGNDDLVGKAGLWGGDPDDDTYRTSPIGHEIMAMPGGTIGLEVQFLNFMSLEVNFQFSMGDPRNNYFLNMAAGAELKVPIKFNNIVLVPYGAGIYFLSDYKQSTPIINPDKKPAQSTFSDFPIYAVGGGIQVCAKGGKNGAFFVDVKYLFSLDPAVMNNPYLAPDVQPLYPNPEKISYNRSVIGLGIGYKIGFIDRKSKPRR